MTGAVVRLFAIVVALCVAGSATSAWAAAPNCRPRCPNVESTDRPTSIIPGPDAFLITGEFFTDQAIRLVVPANGATSVDLGFGFQIGATTYTSVFVNENGALSFGAPLLTSLGSPVAAVGPVPAIAPFSADLFQFPSQDGTGAIYIQRGMDDPFADTKGQYDRTDLRSALKIVWYGLGVGNDTGAPAVFAEALLTGDGAGNNSFAFRWGAPGGDGTQADYGSRAGFVFPTQSLVFGGPYGSATSPSLFDLSNGRVLNATAPVPEPGTWLMLLLGFVVTAFAMRRGSAPSSPLAS